MHNLLTADAAESGGASLTVIKPTTTDPSLRCGESLSVGNQHKTFKQIVLMDQNSTLTAAEVRNLEERAETGAAQRPRPLLPLSAGHPLWEPRSVTG